VAQNASGRPAFLRRVITGVSVRDLPITLDKVLKLMA